MSEAARHRLSLWAVAGCVLLLLAACTYVLESAVFSKPPARQHTSQTNLSTYELCTPTSPETQTACLPHPIQAQISPPLQDTLDEDCLPKAATPRIRKIDARVIRAVNHQWRRIESWLKTHAPRSHRTLAKPAKASEIAAAEAKMGLRFPADLRASLLRHNGSIHLDDTWPFGFLGHTNASVSEILHTWRGLCETDSENLGDEGDTSARNDWWDGRMLPIGADGMGNHLIIDSLHRDIGTTDHEGTMGFSPGETRIRSFHALLKATADAMETNTSIGYWKPRPAAGEVQWDILNPTP